MPYLNYNGRIQKNDEPVITADNRGFRYGDGLFETMKMVNGFIQLADFHFERMFQGMRLLQFDPPSYFTSQYLSTQIQELARKNNHLDHVRIRLVIFRGNGGLYDAQNHIPNYIIQTWEIQATRSSLNENGLVVDIYPEARLSCDSFSHLKTNNYLPYLMAALYAKQNKLNDCLLLNSANHVSDATIANVFLINDDEIITPPLSEGCVAGVMRRYLLENLPIHGFAVKEMALDVADILNATEIFLSNAIQGIRWVRQVRERNYHHTKTSEIFHSIIRHIS